MFRFEHTYYLWLLTALLPMLLAFLWFLRWRGKKLKAFGRPELIAELAPKASAKKHVLKFVLWSLAYIFLVLGIANPQIGSKMEKVKRQGIDVMIALDVSKSMLAEDIKPNRLLRAKNFINNFIAKLNNDRLGIIVFAGRAYLQMPLTVDYSSARMYLKTLGPETVPTQGTAIAEAAELARQSFVQGETKHKALIIITDGEDNEGGAAEVIEAAAKEGVKTFVLGIGTEEGGPIPVYVNGVQGDYKRDADGNIVLSKMNIGMMKDLAAKGNGKAFTIGSGDEAIDAILKELGGISSKTFEEYVFTDFNDQFQLCLAIALLLLIVEYLINERKSNFSFNI
jgi:Ca-activated chloride channel family protein